MSFVLKKKYGQNFLIDQNIQKKISDLIQDENLKILEIGPGDGKLTDKFADAISFVIKSTDPSYVGNDTWFTEDTPEIENYPVDDFDEENPKYNIEEFEAALESWRERLEIARANIDRIAFSGQVPVNITGSFNVGDYIYPQANGTAIEAVAKSNPTFEEYRLCVGKIWAIQEDGRPFVSVKIG